MGDEIKNILMRIASGCSSVDTAIEEIHEHLHSADTYRNRIDYFAAEAMSALINKSPSPIVERRSICTDARIYAEHMIQELDDA